MLTRLRSLYRDWRREEPPGTETGAETTSGSSSPSRSGRPDDGASAAGDGTDRSGRGGRASWHDVLEGEEVSKQELGMEFGLQPHEFLAWLVRDAGGQMWQAEMVETTGWSKSTVSRYLEVLESSGIVERVPVGRRKLVGIPGEMPDHVSVSDGPPAEPAPDSWSSEVDEPV
jgi:hypothetical protein